MSYRKRKESLEIGKAKKRITGIISVDPNADFGNGLSIAAYNNEVIKIQLKVEKYNTLLSEADGILTSIEIDEKNLGEFSQRMLNAVGTKYGYNSIEYEKAGGTRKDDKKRKAKNGNTK